MFALSRQSASGIEGSLRGGWPAGEGVVRNKRAGGENSARARI